MCKVMLKTKTKWIKLENVNRAFKELQKPLNVWPLIRKQGLEKNPKLINVGHEQNVQSYVTKKTSNLKKSVGHGKNSKI